MHEQKTGHFRAEPHEDSQGFMSGGFCGLTLSSACHIVNKTSKLQDDGSGALEPLVCRCVTCTENTASYCVSLYREELR